MQRITITIDDELMTELDQLIAVRGYKGRSEAIRDFARAGIQQALLESNDAPHCVAAAVYVYDHATRDLGRRLAALFHDHHDLSLGTMHVHLNHESGLEVALLKGATKDVRRLAETVLAERGVRYGRVTLIPAVTEDAVHSHAGEEGGHPHSHVRTRA